MNEFNIEVQGGSSVRLPTAGKYCDRDIIVTASGGGGGDTEDFVGFKVSDFTEGYNLPKVVDARSISILTGEFIKNHGNLTNYWFGNVSANANGGYWVQLETVYMPDRLWVISANTFRFCVNLKNLYGDFSSVEAINTQAFYGCKALTDFPYMPKLIKMEANALQNCTGLTEFRFYTKPNTENNITLNIAGTAFNGCTNLKDIYVPWAEGANVGGDAPWGATNENLQIHYNTTYDKNHNPIISEV